VGSGDGAWFATRDGKGRGQIRSVDATGKGVGAEAPPTGFVEGERFLPTVYLYDNYPGGVGLSEPLWQRQGELLARRARSWPAAIARAVSGVRGPGARGRRARRDDAAGAGVAGVELLGAGA
jgi:hypothetical protein